MDLRVLTNSDRNALEAFLVPQLESSMFLLSNSRRAGLEYSGQPLGGTYVAAFERDRIVAVAAHFWTGMIIPQAPRAARELCRALVAASARAVIGFIGPRAQVDEAAAALEIELPAPGKTSPQIRKDEIEGLYALDLNLLIPPESKTASPRGDDSGPSGGVSGPRSRDSGARAGDSGSLVARRALPEDLPLLVEWDLDFAAESLGVTDRAAHEPISRSHQERHVNNAHVWLLERDGQPVARTLFNAAIAEAVQVGGVWTPPPLRNRGYARRVVAASLVAARESGARKAILFTGDRNVAAQRAYAALGFQRIGDFRLTFLH